MVCGPQKCRPWQEAHSHLRLLPEHCEMWLGCFNRSMVAHILPPEVARKLQNCFHTLTSALLERMPRMKSDEAGIHEQPKNQTPCHVCDIRLSGG